MPRRPPLISAAALLLSWTVTGCASRSPEVVSGSPDERRQEIARLDRQIASAEQELGLRFTPPPPATEDAVTGGDGTAVGQAIEPTQADSPPPPMAPAQQEPPMMAGNNTPRAEPGASGGSCARVCRSVAAICEASRRICRLADDLDDAWASGRCEASTRSCDNAERRADATCGDC